MSGIMFDEARLYSGSFVAPNHRGSGVELRVRRDGTQLRPNPDAIAYAFVEAARTFPGEEMAFAGFADRVLQGRVANRSRWIAAAALREVYGGAAMTFLLRPWSERPIGLVIAGQQRQAWWDADLQKRLVVALRHRFGG